MKYYPGLLLLLFLLTSCEKQEVVTEKYFKVHFKESTADRIDVIPDPEYSGYYDEWSYWYFRAIQFRFGNVKGLEQAGDWWCDIYMAYDDFRGPGRYKLGKEGGKGKAWMTFYRVTEQIGPNYFRLDVYPSHASGYPFSYLEVYEETRNSYGIRFHGVLLGGNEYQKAIASGNVTILKKPYYGLTHGHD